MKSYFIVGTDTDCGKTYVTCELVRVLQHNNYQVKAIKPVASGCSESNGQWCNEDAMKLARLQQLNPEDISPWVFHLPVSPHIAAAKEGRVVSAKQIAEYCQNNQTLPLDYLLIEGAGGLIVPLNAEETWLDVLAQCHIPVILVVGMKLGCINHALLTAVAFKANHIQCAGWIANCLTPSMLFVKENIETLAYKLPFPLLQVLEYQGTMDEVVIEKLLS